MMVHFESDSDHWKSAVGIGAAGCFLSIVSVAARMYTRYFVTRSVGVDDLMAIVSLLCTLGMYITLSIYATWYASGNIERWTRADAKNFLLLFWVNELVYNVGTLFIKWTYLFQYLRVFRNVKAMRIAYWVCIVLTGAWYAFQVFGFMFSCNPVAGFWDKSIKSTCNITSKIGSTTGFFYVNAAGTLVIDIVVLVLPIPTIWNLKLRTRQKWAIFGIFAVGGIVPAITIGRMASLHDLDTNGIVNSGIWSLMEMCAGIATAALATIRLLISRKVPVFGTSAPRRQLVAKRASPFSTFGSRARPVTSGSQRDLVVAGFECEMQGGSSTGQSSIDIRKEGDITTTSSRTSTTAAVQNKGGWRESTSEAPLRPNPNLRENTESLHFGLPHGAHGVGVQTTITSDRQRAMSASGAVFLGTFGILVEQDWEVTESNAA
ncbi:hypothetical protein PFICI_10396 [Pestalotiopsis fici W106-1]|uniref:Rhodopsin domain-containing protein n=1 Tax=Pestalotiopsis fici (strain W106-1 / CGMCC3.15140) TaxID=1229662 RepID=W3WX14_PESFW|nr:uncharacterized protein PFICI_10396 [Pestalotiopsis fici W106-1]ETS78334.1 hypothetical protein PFICI_10396 [Pestalotiopsis fici W106-1]